MRRDGLRLRARGLCALAAVALLISWPATAAAGQGRTPDGKPDLSGYWLGSYFVGLQNIETAKGVIVEPADGKIPYLPEMRAKATDIRTNRMADEPELHCFMSGVPHVMYVQFGFQIIQTPVNVTMAWEFMNAFRIIPTDGRPHIHPSIKLFQGDSVGRWEGDVLVIDTTNQNDRTWLDTAGNIHTDAIHVVERLSLADANTIRYEATIEDKEAYTQPWKTTETFKRIVMPDYEQYEFACLEGNRDLQHYTEQAGGKAQSKPQPLLPQ
jgi:hypothetical protein